MHLTPAKQNFILHWGTLNRSVAQIHALLHVVPDPMTAEDICETLNLARSNVSNGLKELQSLKIVTSSRPLGTRRDQFTSVRDMFDLVTIVIESRREREFAPTLAALYEVAKEAETDGTSSTVHKRIDETLSTMQMFNNWYGDVSRLPRTVQLTVIKLGARIARFLPKGKPDK
ncbi:MAG: DNA-binding transcriptional regulator GbsR (MarR family) [Paracoccaceae bacterium]|jgi:DNA-binding transcriptional regulator GbsR (MarR family)